MKENKSWSISLGFYPGILIGVRSYNEENQTTHVFYIPFIDLAIEIYKYWDYSTKEYRTSLLNTLSIILRVG